MAQCETVAFFLSQSCSFFSFLVLKLTQNWDTPTFKHIHSNSMCVKVGFAIPSSMCISDKVAYL